MINQKIERRVAMKEITLICESPYSYKCDISVCDSYNGKLRKRCNISVMYGESDVDELKKSGVSEIEEAIESYRSWLYDTISALLSHEIKIVSGEEELTEIIREHIKDYF